MPTHRDTTPCPSCRLQAWLCVCPFIPHVQTRTPLLLIGHRSDLPRTSNTVRLLTLAIRNAAILPHGVFPAPADPASLVPAGTTPVVLFTAHDTVTGYYWQANQRGEVRVRHRETRSTWRAGTISEREFVTRTAGNAGGWAGGLAGAWVGGQLGGLGGPVAWLTVPAGVLIGGTVGYLAGSDLGRAVAGECYRRMDEQTRRDASASLRDTPYPLAR